MELVKVKRYRLKTARKRCFWKKVAVDDIVHPALLERVMDIGYEKEMFVLLTGDGTGYTDRRGGVKQLERIRNSDNKIEVVSWDEGCNRYLKAYAEQNGRYRSLETVYNRISLIENKRWAI